jgi:hypothetical protein
VTAWNKTTFLYYFIFDLEEVVLVALDKLNNQNTLDSPHSFTAAAAA